MTTVRWGMLSAGNIARQFAEDIKLVGNARATTVAARDGDAARSFADAHGIERAYEGYDALFNDPDIDAIYISTPHNFHARQALDALASSKAVMCEKPITTSLKELDNLLTEAGKANQYLLEAMWTWFLPAIRTAKDWVNEGRIGELLHVNAGFGFGFAYDPNSRLYNPDLAGGCLLDMGIYPIALARYFYESAPVSLASKSRFAPTGVENDVAMQFEYENGVATLMTSLRTTLPNAAYIIGSKGYIYIPQFWRAQECQLFVRNELKDSFCDNRRGGGFEFQIEQASKEILAGRTESSVVTHSASRGFQADIDWVKSQF